MDSETRMSASPTLPSIGEIRKAAQAPSNFWWSVFYYPSGWLVWMSARLRLTPNHLTLTALMINLAGALTVLAAPPTAVTIAVAYILFFIGHVFDFADGQMANAMNARSRRGAWLDSSFDIVKSALVTICYLKLIYMLGYPIRPMLSLVASLAAMGSLVNYTVGLAANAYRPKIDPYENAQSPLSYSLSIYGLKGRASRVILSNIREYGNFLLIFLIFLVNSSMALVVLTFWGLAQWLLAANRIRHVSDLLRVE